MGMRKFYLLLALMLIGVLLGNIVFVENNSSHIKKIPKQQRIQGALDDKFFTSVDVDLGVIPYDKLFAAIREGQRRLLHPSSDRTTVETLADAVFRDRGPNNIGGRTRAIHIDESDPNRNRIWVGGVSGGLWRSEDITQNDPQWIKIGTEFENISIGDIAQDPNELPTFYVGTGESYTQFPGIGIFKTLDDGLSWTLLPFTSNSNFEYINELYVHSNSDIYAATATGGLFKSMDGGDSFEKVLGTSLSGANNNNFHDIIYNEINQTFYTSNANSVYKSLTGNRGDWTSIGAGKPGFPSNVNRVELAVCPADPNIMYVLGAIGGAASNTFISNNGGENWSSKASPSVPPYDGCEDIACGQAGYDLDIAVDPFSCGHIVVGGITLWESAFQAVSWQKYIFESQTIGDYHHDQHTILFDPKKPGRIYYGNDGGIYMSNNNGQSAVHKNLGYVTTQYYCGAIHPEKGSPYLLGGTQDNGSHQILEAGLSPAVKVGFGDGVFCFIDEDNPEIQIISSQYGNYNISMNGGFNFVSGVSVNGGFINRSGYDDMADILYGQINQSGVDDVDFFRWDVHTLQVDAVDITGFNINVSAVKADPAEPNRIYFGGQAGLVLSVDNAHSDALMTTSVFADLPGNASVSSVYMDKQTSDDVLISLFNYGGSLENLWVTYTAGDEWEAIEGDLPDMPINWAIFDPSDHNKVMIATEAGVWVTDDVDGNLTHWQPLNPANGMPFVDVDMLLVREMDKIVLAATYGRGLMTTDIFAAPAPVILAQPIAYVGQTVVIDGSQSVNAQAYQWDLGDNTTSNESLISHTYSEAGTYIIELTINGDVTDTKTISVLPFLPTPYQSGGTDYAGDFESQPEHFAAYTVQGTGFQRGVSTKPGKDGTNSGAFAWVLGINDNVYQNNTRAELYTPMYDFSQPGLYELKFYSKYAIHNLDDGFQVEYTTDGGASWTQLGTNENQLWYNYLNSNITNGAFPLGKSYFTNAKLNWTQSIKDVSFLAGLQGAAFRFVFRSDGEDQAQGLAIDDFEITRYAGELQTTITQFNASYTGEQEITINWTTGIEYHAQRFLLERSFTGFGFTEVSNTPAKGIVSTFATAYSRVDQSLRDVIYYRLKVINENPDIGYAYTFYSDTIVVRRDVEENIVHNVLPNPFADQIGISFSSIIDQQVTFRLYDSSGKLILEDIAVPDAVSYTIDQLNLSTGIYFLTVRIGEGALKAYKLFTAGS